MTKTIEIDYLLSDEIIENRLVEQRSRINADIDEIIKNYLKTTNVNLGKNLLAAIEHFDDPEEGFTAWKQYYADSNEQDLIESVKEQDITFWDRQSLTWNILKDSEIEQGKNSSSLKTIFARVAQCALSNINVAIFARKFQNGLNLQQMTVLGYIQSGKETVDGPLTEGNHLMKSLAPYIKTSIENRFLNSLKELRSVANDPLVAEDIVWSYRDEVLHSRAEQFERLADQSFGETSKSESREPLNFNSSQVPDDITFGVEFEGFMPTDLNFAIAGLRITRLFNAVGLNASIFSIMPKTESAFDKWDTVFDSSVQNPLSFTGLRGKNKFDSLGLEIVSPILEGVNGAKQVALATKVLNITALKTNESCGMHVHVGLQNTTLEQRKNLAKALVKNEQDMDRLVDPNRRGTNNPYCKSVSDVSIEEIDAATNDNELVEVLNPETDRNSKYDMTGLVRDGAPETIQYRGEGGAGYLSNATGYTIALVNFTKEAFDNPDIKFEDVLVRLREEKPEIPSEKLKPAQRPSNQTVISP